MASRLVTERDANAARDAEFRVIVRAKKGTAGKNRLRRN
jgi:hypothetical protein